MTYAELESKMSSQELDLWMAEDALRADECPYCGVEPKRMMEYRVNEINCPVCREKYRKTVPVTELTEMDEVH